MAQIAGPQLVCPVDNPRYILNATNARWGSLLDAFYGTDVLPESDGLEKGTKYNPARGAAVFGEVNKFLDLAFPLTNGSHADVTSYTVERGALAVTFADGSTSGLTDASTAFTGYTGSPDAPSGVMLHHNGLGVEILVNRGHPIGAGHNAGVYDVQIESALSTIADLEDSVAAVDAEDKTNCYRTWLRLMKGELTASLGGNRGERTQNSDSIYTSPSGEQEMLIPRRSLMLVRNVGMHRYTDAVTLPSGAAIPEHVLDALMTSLAGLHDLNGTDVLLRNSRHGSIFIVKPKMHGPDEVAMNVALFDRVEDELGLPRHTLKMGIMDEERRTSANLGACMEQAKDRVCFINTGFLDRTGDEIHTSMEAGAVVPKAQIKGSTWLTAYENNNVSVGLNMQLAPGRGQIGKGMWAAPDNMADMMAAKIAHPQAGASTAWVPSPTAATLHALHYHYTSVLDVQNEMLAVCSAETETERAASLARLLTPPIMPEDDVAKLKLNDDEVTRELENNCQSILGYVSRWVGQGVGCSKVPDIDGLQQMEDLATLRISSQHLANWLHHGVCTPEQVDTVLERMAAVVDQQNEGDAAYNPMAKDVDASFEFQAARDLIFQGRNASNGYTEETLGMYRRKVKGACAGGAETIVA
mmetsp:Transcript_56142/g.154751  ORF Transcript_56142/g.154751 Transcript_56142/m.154751 type:complete len:640 (+) Transcript_56142:688-2607(+)